MKTNFTLAFFLLLAQITTAWAAGPTTPSSALSFPANRVDGDRFGISFNKGNGAFRIIVMKEGSAVSTAPVNGTDYTSGNLQYGMAGAAFNTNDGFVVFRGSHGTSNVSLTVTGLQPNTTYYVSIWEFNGSGGATEYLSTALTGNATTLTVPTGQSVISSFTNVAGNKLTVNWTGGTGDKTLLLARKGAPVNANPEQLKKYLASNEFGSGNAINGDNYVVYLGSGASANITNLEPNTEYHFAIFELNGTEGPVYKLPGNTASQLTNAGPTQASGNINFVDVEGDRLTLSFSPGNGKYHLIIGRKGQAVTAVPQNGQTYTANTAYGSGYMFPTGDFVLNSTANERTFTQLDPSSTYYFRVYEYDVDAMGNTYYLTGSYSEKSGNTAFPPASQPSGVYFENITGNSVTMKYTPGLSAYRLIVIKAGSPVDAVPADLTTYNGIPTYSKGQQITPDNYVIYGQTNSSAASINGLTPGVKYYVSVWGYNGNNYPVYGQPPATGSVIIPNEPAAAATNFTTNTIEGNSMRLQWSGGDGANRLVIARKSAPVSVTPVDGVTYHADAQFQHGDLLGSDEYVVYDGPNRVTTIENLEAGANYYFAVFEYNLAGGVPDYLNTTYLPGQESTASAPVTGPSALAANEIQAKQVKISFSAGDGKGRLFIMRAGAPVDVEPQDLVSYNASNVYGSVEFGNTGNYIVQRSTGSAAFNVTNLAPNTRYYVKAFEYNGASAPVYLRPGASFDFMTGVALPLKWLSFTSKEVNNGVLLSWSTTEEINTSYFIVERSSNNIDYTPLDTLVAKGSAVHNDYSYEDRQQPAGHLFYRIRQVDRDDRYEYSKVIIVNVTESNAALKLYPNPASGAVRIQLPGSQQQATVQLFTQAGALVRTFPVSNQQIIPLQNLPKGVYYIVAGNRSGKLIIQ